MFPRWARRPGAAVCPSLVPGEHQPYSRCSTCTEARVWMCPHPWPCSICFSRVEKSSTNSSWFRQGQSLAFPCSWRLFTPSPVCHVPPIDRG